MSCLDEVWQWYEAAQDSLRIVRALWEIQPELIPKHFVTRTIFDEPQRPDEVLARLRQAERELDDFTVVALWLSSKSDAPRHCKSRQVTLRGFANIATGLLTVERAVCLL